MLICHELVKVQFYHDQEIPTQLGPSKFLRSGEFCTSWQQSGVYNSRMSAQGSNLWYYRICLGSPYVQNCTILWKWHDGFSVCGGFLVLTACRSFGMPFSLLVIYAGALASFLFFIFLLKINGCIHWLLAHPLAFEALWVRLKRLSWRFGMTHNMANARCHARYMYVVRHKFSVMCVCGYILGRWS